MDIALLRERLSYNPETGELIWNERPIVHKTTKSFNLMFAGKSAGSMDRHGRLSISYSDPIDGRKRHQAHRLIWTIYYGVEPSETIDHIDGNPLNNTIANLREATFSENQRNRGAHKDNSTGLKGVLRKRNRWEARICVNRTKYYLGVFDTPEAAHSAYCEAARRYHGEFARFA